MNKVYIAWAILIPLAGCTGVICDNPGGAPSDGASVGGTTTNTSLGGSTSVNGSAGGATIDSAGGTGSNGMLTSGGVTAVGGGASGGQCTLEVLPTSIQTMLTNRCATCHGVVPLAPTLPTLLTYADLTAPAKSDPSKTNAVVTLARLQNTAMPMPPAPGAPATASEVGVLQDFIAQGYPKPSCPPPVTGGGGMSGTGGATTTGGAASGGAGGGPNNDPLFAMPICTSNSSWTGGDRGSASMNPGMACISCHDKGGEGPSFSIAGTVYPTGHEPDRCNSLVGGEGAKVVIIGADGQTLTLTPNGVGNFSSRTSIRTPYQAKVTYQGRERLMLTAQTSGDCNACHGQNASMMAPGRITVP
jgi:hypothetical protein